ncbi:hypothetical protein [Robiginitalea sp. IMCC43444]|uniref:hypothetical protein n=1 Tax=Robiginitalea sp. IMCC43444 TaxID=3459121 RepID=UPI004042E89A
MNITRLSPLILVILLAFAPFNGAAQKKAKLTPDVKDALKTARVLLVRYEAPPLDIMTPKDVAGAGLVANLTKSDIADNRERHRFYPSEKVQKNLDKLLQEQGFMTQIALKPEAFDFTMPSGLKDVSKYADADADYIIEVIVPLMGWRATYGATKWSTYSLNLGVEVRIIRKSDLARVWKTNVGHGGYNDKELKFHITELEENGKELIAGLLDTIAVECARKVVENYAKAKK